MSNAAAQTSGIVLCSRYAFKPNELGYCGPDDSAGLFELTLKQKRSRGYEQLLGGFETLYPYLTFIARNIGARDPFDSRVVEAYWLGAPASQRLSLDGFYDHFAEGLKLKKKLPRSVLEHLVGKIPQGARPNHNFHVLNVFTRTGHLSQPHTLETMDQCRISWGIVQSVDHHKGEAVILRQKLESVDGRLKLAEACTEIVKYIWQGGTFTADLQSGDTVSCHWNWLCARLAPLEAAWIKRSTLDAIRFHNQPR